MLKLLIADATEETRQALEEAFQQRCAVKVCADGEMALELLQKFSPDILVLNLMLPKVDGLSVLQQLRQWQMPTMVLVQTAIDSPYVMNRLHQLGAEYVMRMPCLTSALEMQLMDFMRQLQDAPPQTHCEDRLVTGLLMQLGFSTKVGGYSYLADAIPLYARDPSQAITKELYVAVGQLHGKDASLIERSIRSAINKAWKEGDKALWQKYFRCLPDGTVERPSNGHFITRMAQLLMGRSHEIAIA